MIKSSDLSFYSYSTIRKLGGLKIDRHSFFDDDMLHRLYLCQNIKDLEIHKNNSLDYINLYRFEKIKRVSVVFDKDDNGKFRVNFNRIKNKVGIVDISLEYYYLTATDLKDISEFSNLKTLRLINCTFPPKSLDCLKNLKKLQTLIINKTVLEDVFFITENLTNLEVLNLNENKIGVFPRLDKMKKLKTLTLRGNLLDNMLFVGSIGYIEMLDLSDNRIENFCVKKNQNKKNHIFLLNLCGNPIKNVVNMLLIKNFKCEDLIMRINNLPFKQYSAMIKNEQMFGGLNLNYRLSEGFYLTHTKFLEYSFFSTKKEVNVYKIKNNDVCMEEFEEYLIKLMV